MISYDEYKKIEMTVGKVLSAESVEGSEKLLKLSVDFGEESPRTVVSGIAKYFPAGEGLVGVKCVFCTNLEPRPLMGLESQAMILATGEGETFSLLKVSESVSVGERIR